MMERLRGTVLALAAVVLLVPGALPAEAAGWLQAGHDAGRSGATSGYGPVWGDVALVAHLPAGVAPSSTPLVVGDSVLVLTANADGSGSAVERVGLADGRVDTLVQYPGPAHGFAADAERVFFTTPHGVRAHYVEDGALAWEWRITDGDAAFLRHECVAPAVLDGHVVVACTAWREGTGEDALVDHANPVVFIARLHASSGTLAGWMRLPPAGVGADGNASGPHDGQVARRLATSAMGAGVLARVWVGGDGENEPVPVHSFARFTAHRMYWFSPEDRPRWDHGVQAAPETGDAAASSRAVPWDVTSPVVFGEAVFTRLENGAVTERHASTGVVRREYALTTGERDERGLRGGMAATSSELYVAAGHSVHAFDRGSGELLWRTVTRHGELWAPDALVLADGVLYGRAVTHGNAQEHRTFAGELVLTNPRNPLEAKSTIHALDASTGEILWTHALPQGEPAFERDRVAVGNGVLVVAGVDGNVTVLGRTAASPSAALRVSDARPDPGETVAVDLSGSGRGLHGPVTEYRVHWGDGSVTEWGTEPILRHAYARPGEHRAVASVRNDAGQSASAFVTIDVGGTTTLTGVAGVRGVVRDHGPWMAVAGVGMAGLAVLVGGRRFRASHDPQPPRSAATPAPGALFLGKYVVERELGRGAFGRTWLAAHPDLGRQVVIKELHPELSGIAEARKRFQREAQILASLDHPHVTRVHHVERVGESWFIVMEFVDGGTLQDRVACDRVLEPPRVRDPEVTWGVDRRLPRPLPTDEAARIVAQVLDGLAFIHDRGIVHRDLKPSNVLLTADGTAKIADFGVARSREFRSGLLTSPGSSPPGTLVYMAPEQVRGETGDERSDLYAVGVVFLHLVTGRFYLGEAPSDEFELRRAILEHPPAVPADAPPALAAWVRRALAKDPSARFATAREMRDALHHAVE